MEKIIEFEVSYNGSTSDNHQIDLYDVSRAMMGFHRSFAITSQMMLHNELIHKSTSLKNAHIYTFPQEEGSWQMKFALFAALTSPFTLPNNTVIGHLGYSLYDYVISESLGVHVDFNKTIGKIYEENTSLPRVEQHQLDDVVHKCTGSIIDMHRPISHSSTANNTIIRAIQNEKKIPLSTELTLDTYNYIEEEILSENEFTVTGTVSGISASTFSGRIEVSGIDRPVPFVLDKSVKNDSSFVNLLESLRAKLNGSNSIKVTMDVQPIQNRTGRLKKYLVKKLWKNSLD